MWDITYQVFLLLEAGISTGNKPYRLIQQIPGQAGWDHRGRAVSMVMENSRDGRYLRVGGSKRTAALLPTKVVSCFGDRCML